MKCKALFLLLFLPFCLAAQNLVPNPSFEQYEECPNSHSQFESLVTNWESWQESPDYFNTCNNELSGIVGVPNNIIGYQRPITGVAYASIYTATHNSLDGREYIAVQLIEPLEVGQNYYAYFHASWFDGGEETAICATNHIGLRFFKDPDYNNIDNPFYPDNFSHLDYNQMLVDSSNWVKIDGWVTANDTYNWVAIGNFYDDENTDTLMLNNEGTCFAMYYIENVCVAKTQEECDYLLNIKRELKKQDIHVYPNPATNIVTIHSTNYMIQRIQIREISGRVIEVISSQNAQNVNINTENLSPGIYLFQIEYNNRVLNHKIIIQ